LNREKVTDENLKVTADTFRGRRMVLLGLGKSSLHLLLRS
jgi:hypothetical protein